MWLVFLLFIRKHNLTLVIFKKAMQYNTVSLITEQTVYIRQTVVGPVYQTSNKYDIKLVLVYAMSLQ